VSLCVILIIHVFLNSRVITLAKLPLPIGLQACYTIIQTLVHQTTQDGSNQSCKLYRYATAYVYVFSSLLLIVNSLWARRWPSKAETCRHRLTNKLRSLDSCVLTDLPILICIKHNEDYEPEAIVIVTYQISYNI
jgi:hypothetical protein